uniref:Mitochondrial distribution and morphology protein 12 n=1 Tax=Candidozyma auris TaxID=498019 RepID=A0A0L0NS77_CANAR
MRSDAPDTTTIMSFDINWDKLVADNSLNESIREFLDIQLNQLLLPPYIDNLTVTKFSLGTKAPEITIRHVGDPFDEFYEEGSDGEEENAISPAISDLDTDSVGNDTDDAYDGHTTLNETGLKESLADLPPSPPPLMRDPHDILRNFHAYSMNNVGLGHHHMNAVNESETPTNIFAQNTTKRPAITPGQKTAKRDCNDLQTIVEFDYHGDLSMEVTVHLLVNYPSAQFITLPIKLHITDLVIHSLAVVAYLKKCIYVAFLCDLNDAQQGYFGKSNGLALEKSTNTPSVGGNFVDYSSPTNHERIDVIKSVKIESEIGELGNNVLRNVGKVERFLIDQLRTIIREEIAWPSWVCFDLNDDEEDDPNDGTSDDRPLDAGT